MLLEQFPFRAFEQHLFRREIAQQLVHIVEISLGGQEFTRRYIEKSHTHFVTFPEMNTRQEIILSVIENIVVNRHARCHQFRNAALDQFFCQFRVFQLFANSYPFSGTHQFGKVSIESMMGKTGQLHILGGSICPASQCNPQYFRCHQSIVRKRFIKVPHPEKQYRIGMLGFHLDILFHQRSCDNFLGHDIFLLYSYE